MKRTRGCLMKGAVPKCQLSAFWFSEGTITDFGLNLEGLAPYDATDVYVGEKRILKMTASFKPSESTSGQSFYKSVIPWNCLTLFTEFTLITEFNKFLL